MTFLSCCHSLLTLALLVGPCVGFHHNYGFAIVSSTPRSVPSIRCQETSTRLCHHHPDALHHVIAGTLSMAEEGAVGATPTSWRQYVPLVVIAGVILDIVLGSPLLNKIAAPLRPPDDTYLEYDNNNDSSSPRRNPKERIDTTQFAQQALDKAEAALELKRFLEENKSDWQKVQEVQDQVDQQMKELDQDLWQRQMDLDQRRQQNNNKANADDVSD